MKLFQPLIIVSLACLAVACSDGKPRFVVEGTVSDADSSVLYLEKREINNITLLDSVRLNSKGDFKFKDASTPYPEFYVLRMDGQVINFAVDSAETVKVDASKNSFATDYTIEGNLANQQIKSVVLAQYKASQEINAIRQKLSNKEIDEQASIGQLQSVVDAYKETARQIIFSNLKSPAAYFALFQTVNGQLFFDPYDSKDYKLFAAVATSWDTYFKDSPRTPQLKNYTLLALRTRKRGEMNLDSVNQINADEYYNIDLPDVNGKNVKLTSLKGKVVLLDFTTYQAKESPAHNIILNNIYSKFKPNLEIYQVSLDSDEHLWSNAVLNLPWIAVHESKSINSDLVFKYNIQGFPTMYLLDRDGQIVKRLLPTDNIESEIQKII